MSGSTARSDTEDQGGHGPPLEQLCYGSGDYAITVSTAVRNIVTRTMFVALLLRNN